MIKLLQHMKSVLGDVPFLLNLGFHHLFYRWILPHLCQKSGFTQRSFLERACEVQSKCEAVLLAKGPVVAYFSSLTSLCW